MILLNGKEVPFGRFPNGETHVITTIEATEEHPALNFFKQNMEQVNILSFKYEDDADLIKLMFVKNHMDLIATVPCYLLVYYMPYSRMDRSEGGSVFTLKYVSAFINSLYFDKVFVIEPHSDVTCALLDRSKPLMVNQFLVNYVMNEIDFDFDNDFLVYPDAGAEKRYEKMFDLQAIVGLKHRDFQTGYITKLDLVTPGIGKKAIIVDDLSSKGGTFIMAADELKKRGFEEIYLCVAHAEDTIFKGKIFTESPINKVFTTNSILSDQAQHDWANQLYKDKIDVTDVEELIVLD
jgi:ribose-phosphate pyrophosphokinase